MQKIIQNQQLFVRIRRMLIRRCHNAASACTYQTSTLARVALHSAAGLNGRTTSSQSNWIKRRLDAHATQTPASRSNHDYDCHPSCRPATSGICLVTRDGHLQLALPSDKHLQSGGGGINDTDPECEAGWTWIWTWRDKHGLTERLTGGQEICERVSICKANPRLSRIWQILTSLCA